MNWYYSNNGQQAGPVSETEIANLMSSGAINDRTLVWREGMADWQPLATAIPALASAPQAAPQLGGVAVPVAQKDLYVQQMREGVASTAPGAMRFAGFWIRFVARFVDGLIMWVVHFMVGMVIGLLIGMAAGGGEKTAVALPILLFIVNMITQAAYEIIMLRKYGATLGKMAVGIKVVRADGAPLSTGLSVGRYFAQMLSGLILMIGYIIAAFDSQKRTLHDHICSTRVIKVR